MRLDIREEAGTAATLGEHAKISITFVVDRIPHVTLADRGLGGVSLTETAVPDPYVKDYDAVEGSARGAAGSSPTGGHGPSGESLRAGTVNAYSCQPSVSDRICIADRAPSGHAGLTHSAP